MVEQNKNSLRIDRIDQRSLVSLRVLAKNTARCQSILKQAESLQSAGAEISTLRYGPAYWLLVSEQLSPRQIIDHFNMALLDLAPVHLADQSAAYSVFRLSGPSTFDVLSSGCGLDFRPSAFQPGCVKRTRLAMIRASLVSVDEQTVEVYLDRSHAHYFDRWLQEALRNCCIPEVQN